MGFSQVLRARAEPVWQAQLQHPFVRGIAAGTLASEPFQHWLRQDYLFLIEYCRLFALAAARAADLDTLGRFADLLQATARTEMGLHRAYAGQFGITGEELEREQMAPTTRAYTDFLVRTAATGDFAELLAALLPCMWGYSELGQALAAEEPVAGNPYQAWIDMYSDAAFTAQAGWCRDLVDRAGEAAGEAIRSRMQDAFTTSSRYELAFWEMAWTGERW